MAIVVKTDEPAALVAAIKKGIDDEKITLWLHDSDGDFTRTDEAWKGKAWLRPVIRDDRVIFRIFPPRNTVMSKSMYAAYHARFIEMLLRNFDDLFSEAVATALPKHGDQVNTQSKQR
jgi:hypothetical protein